MGLTTWKNSPDGRILKSDVTIAKNYLPEKDTQTKQLLKEQLEKLENLQTGF
jgi:hypothetical protein